MTNLQLEHLVSSGPVFPQKKHLNKNNTVVVVFAVVVVVVVVVVVAAFAITVVSFLIVAIGVNFFCIKVFCKHYQFQIVTVTLQFKL